MSSSGLLVSTTPDVNVPCVFSTPKYSAFCLEKALMICIGVNPASAINSISKCSKNQGKLPGFLRIFLLETQDFGNTPSVSPHRVAATISREWQKGNRQRYIAVTVRKRHQHCGGADLRVSDRPRSPTAIRTGTPATGLMRRPIASR